MTVAQPSAPRRVMLRHAVLRSNCVGRVRSVAALAGALMLSWASDATAVAPLGRYLLTPSTVHDRATGLTWQRAHTASKTWAEADAICAALTLDSKAWRLPTIREIESLIDRRAVGTRKVDLIAFPEMAAADAPSHFWSSTTMASNTGYTWSGRFDNGGNTATLRSYTLAVRCVRTGP